MSIQEKDSKTFQEVLKQVQQESKYNLKVKQVKKVSYGSSYRLLSSH